MVTTQKQPSKDLKTMRHLKHLSYTKNLVELFNLKKRRLKRNLITVFQYVQDHCKEEEDYRYSLVVVCKARGNGFVLQNERFRSDTRRKRLASDLLFQKSIKTSIWIPITKCIGLVDTVLRKRNGQRDFKMVAMFTSHQGDASVH